jgi:hypothetical protein
MHGSAFALLSALDALTGALFLLTALGVVGTRQVLAPCNCLFCNRCC